MASPPREAQRTTGSDAGEEGQKTPPAKQQSSSLDSDSGDELQRALAAAACARKRGLSNKIATLKESKDTLNKERLQVHRELRLSLIHI